MKMRISETGVVESFAVGQLDQIPVNSIYPSPTNPRKHISQEQLEQFAQSIQNAGIKVPLTLRYNSAQSLSMLEIVSGERRWRAAKIAGLSTVPAIVREMSDAECRETQLIENLQRSDLGPMEEAEAYGSLELPIEVLAAKVGKTVPYVTQRLKLLGLIVEGRTALRDGVLNLTLALLAARLQAADQEKAVLYAIDPKRITQGKDLGARIADAKKRLANDEHWYRCASETEMREWIKGHTLLTLKGVAWRLDDPDLISGAGPCTECPKRAGNSTALFGDLAAEEDTCTDPTCYAKKEKAVVRERLKAEVSAIRLVTLESHMPVKEGATLLKMGQWVEAKEGSCPEVVKGVTEEGHVKTVCPNQKCKKHVHRVDKPLAKGQSSRDWEAEEEARKVKEAAYVAAEGPIRRAVYAVIRPKLKGAKLLRLVISELRADFVALAEIRGIAVKGEGYKAHQAADAALAVVFGKLKDADIEGWLADVLASDAVSVNGHRYDQRKEDRKALWNIGAVLGIDCDVIAAKVEGERKKAAAKPGTPPLVAAKKVAKKKAVRK